MKPPEDIASILVDVSPALAEALERAYALGFTAGGEAMRATIFEAASRPFTGGKKYVAADLVGPGVVMQVKAPQRLRSEGGGEGMRAPRGAVSRAVAHVLGESPGLSTKEVREYVGLVDDQVSPKSIDNELSRHRDERYRYDNGKWFLISNAEKETAEHPSRDHSAVEAF